VNGEEAIKWMTKSAEQGDEDAIAWLKEEST
jgi:TPR repeat protein